MLMQTENRLKERVNFGRRNQEEVDKLTEIFYWCNNPENRAGLRHITCLQKGFLEYKNSMIPTTTEHTTTEYATEPTTTGTTTEYATEPTSTEYATEYATNTTDFSITDQNNNLQLNNETSVSESNINNLNITQQIANMSKSALRNGRKNKSKTFPLVDWSASRFLNNEKVGCIQSNATEMAGNDVTNGKFDLCNSTELTQSENIFGNSSIVNIDPYEAENTTDLYDNSTQLVEPTNQVQIQEYARKLSRKHRIDPFNSAETNDKRQDFSTISNPTTEETNLVDNKIPESDSNRQSTFKDPECQNSVLPDTNELLGDLEQNLDSIPGPMSERLRSIGYIKDSNDNLRVLRSIDANENEVGYFNARSVLTFSGVALILVAIVFGVVYLKRRKTKKNQKLETII